MIGAWEFSAVEPSVRETADLLGVSQACACCLALRKESDGFWHVVMVLSCTRHEE